jgi:hypothetical protein
MARNLKKVVLIHWPSESSGQWLVEISGKDGSYSPILELTQENLKLLDNLSAVRELIAAAQSWHQFHHGSDVVQCDDICKALGKLVSK